MNSVGAPPLRTPNYPNQRKVPLKDNRLAKRNTQSERGPILALPLLEVHLGNLLTDRSSHVSGTSAERLAVGAA